jgi:phytoene synthase
LRAGPRTALTDVLDEFRTFGKKRLEEARAKQSGIPSSVFPAFLPVALTQLYLDRLEKMGIDCLRQTAEISQLRRQLRLYRSARTGKFYEATRPFRYKFS